MALLCASHEAEGRFEETAWSVVIAAGATTEPRAHAALTQLCQVYWRPIYAYLRRSGYATHDAQDLTQSFFQHLLENETLAARLAREGALPQFPSRRAEALPGRRAGATAYPETRRPHTIHLNRRARGRGAPSRARGS